MAGARALWRATGMKDGDFGKPIIGIANSFTQFVPGHVHLHDIGQLVAREIEKCGGVAKEFDTIAVDDGICSCDFIFVFAQFHNDISEGIVYWNSCLLTNKFCRF